MEAARLEVASSSGVVGPATAEVRVDGAEVLPDNLGASLEPFDEDLCSGNQNPFVTRTGLVTG